jgi:hypothetical protein
MTETETTGKVKTNIYNIFVKEYCYAVTYLPEEEWLLIIDWV